MLDFTLTPAARLYAVKELARRAGVTASQFRAWRIQTNPDATIVYPEPGSAAAIMFPVTHAVDLEACTTHGWMSAGPPRSCPGVADLIVPFIPESGDSGQPLFRRSGDKAIACSTDLLTVLVLVLSRFEETQRPERDEHGRFPATAAIAYRRHFLERPIVDEYGFAFEEAMLRLIPRWQAGRRRLRVKLSHDIDDVGVPFRVKTVAGHALRRKNVRAALTDCASTVSSVLPRSLAMVQELVRLSLDRELDSALYWKATAWSRFDTGYDISHPKVARVLAWARERSVEMGVHPAYDTFRAPDRLRAEVDRLRKALGVDRPGGRQHFLRWAPETWADWEKCGMAYDSSVGFADRVGFRAGTSIPYLPWSFVEDRALHLLEIPLIVMDVTLLQYMNLEASRAVEAVRRLRDSCAVAGGVFTVLWHNSALLDPAYRRIYPPILDLLRGNARYDWEADRTGLLSAHE
ncbi:MAG TPA: polysaccharide deacetylase family protein [Bryobacteraceae bacterium]